MNKDDDVLVKAIVELEGRGEEIQFDFTAAIRCLRDSLQDTRECPQ